MRVNEIREAIENLRPVLAAGGAGAAERELAKLVELLGTHDDRDLDEFIAEIRSSIEAAKPDPSIFVNRLVAAGDDEARFKSALAEVAAAATVKKPEALDIAKRYGVIRIDTKSRASIIESIEKHFYWMLYQRDADAMAKRATPW